MTYMLAAHPLVDDDLFEILALVSRYAGLETGTRKVSAISKRIDELLYYPHVGSIRDEIHPGLRAIPASDKAVICLTVDDESRTVYIIAVTYAGADWQAVVRERN